MNALAARAVSLAITALITLPVQAQMGDAPKRKPGLWEVKTTMASMGGHVTAVQQCIDAKTDDLMQRQGQEMADANCSKNSVRRAGDKVYIESVCKFQGTTATTKGVFSGRFDSAYRGDLDVSYDPPTMGMKQAKMTVEATWLGACKPGQKPGDIIVPGMGNMPSMEQMKEMMKNMQRQ